MKILAISYGKNLFNTDSEDSRRNQLIANRVEAYHSVVFTRAHEDFSTLSVSNKFFLYPTSARTRLGMLVSAYRIGRNILRSDREADWVVTAQDPFESALVAWFLRIGSSVSFHFNIQEHGNFFGHPHWRKESFGNRFRTLLGRWLIRRADTVRVVSDRIARSLIAFGISEDKLLKLTVETDVNAFLNAEPSNELSHTANEETVVGITLARFVPQKNLALLVRAFATVAAGNASYRLVIVGRGRLQTKLFELVQELNMNEQITFMDWTDNAPGLLRAADLYALSSNYEGWGRVLVEAMAAGLPIVTTDVGGVGEILIDNTEGLVVPVGDQGAFGQALSKLYGDATLRQRLGMAGHARATKISEETREVYADEWVALYENKMA